MNKEYKLGSIVVMKKQHPCGTNEWEITRVGADIKINGAKVAQFPFDKAQTTNKKEKVVNINIKYILIGILVAVILVGVGFGIYHFADNFYLIRYKFGSKRPKGFKKIKQRKNRRRRRWF